MVPESIRVLWLVLLIVLVIGLPVILFALHRLWSAARGIERYFAEMLTAGLGIAGNTAAIPALDDTIAGAGALLDTAGTIHSDAETLRAALAARAGVEGG